MNRNFKQVVGFIITTSIATLSTAAVNIGVLQGFTGPIESLTPMMAKSAELALKEASDSGVFLGGEKIKAIRADSTCIDSAAAVTSAERLLDSSNVVAIIGASCSGATTAVVNKVLAPKGMVGISSSATSPALSQVNDKGYFFRTAPSDASQGQVLAKIVMNKGIKNIAITYTNNDYGKGLSESFGNAYKGLGGRIEINAPHEDDKADYSAEVGALSASGANSLAVFGYVDKGGRGIVQASLDSDAFEQFIFADGMIGESITNSMGRDLNGTFGTMPGGESEANKKWDIVAENGGIKLGGPYLGGSYDAAAIIVLAIQAGNSTNRSNIQKNIMNVANAPGTKIFAGELKKGLNILANGGNIDYVGATDIEFSDIGEVSGTYQEMEVKSSKFELVKIH